MLCVLVSQHPLLGQTTNKAREQTKARTLAAQNCEVYSHHFACGAPPTGTSQQAPCCKRLAAAPCNPYTMNPLITHITHHYLAMSCTLMHEIMQGLRLLACWACTQLG